MFREKNPHIGTMCPIQIAGIRLGRATDMRDHFASLGNNIAADHWQAEAEKWRKTIDELYRSRRAEK